MNLIEPVVVVLMFGLGGACGIIGWQEGGPMFGVLGGLVGVMFFPMLALAAVHVAPTFSGRPYWPECRDCRRDAFSHEFVHGRCVARCGCGAAYVRRGRQCLRLLPGGATRPYLRWRPLLGWASERASDPAELRAPYRDDHDSAF